jgi:carnosine N-methyltransferase
MEEWSWLTQWASQFFYLIVGFFLFRKHCFKKIGRQKKHYLDLSVAHRNKLPAFPTHLDALQQCTDVNYQFILRILEHIPFDEPIEPSPTRVSDTTPPVGTFHMDKVHTTLRMFMRDWSREGSPERQEAYEPILTAIREYVPIKDWLVPFLRFFRFSCWFFLNFSSDKGELKVLNPGAGLGRLPWELAKLGYASFGNEFSLYMLFASNFVLNW